jgi:hypothetical protein
MSVTGAPPLGKISGELIRIQINTARIPSIGGTNLTRSVKELYGLITLWTILRKHIYLGPVSPLVERIMKIQIEIAQLDATEKEFADSCLELSEYISLATLVQKWIYTYRLWAWKRKQNLVSG